MNSGNQQFDRVASLVIAPIDGGLGFNVSGLRVVFDVSKKSASAPNKANVRVYNLSRDHRLAIKAKKQAIILKAGYGKSMPLLASGVIQRVEHSAESPNVVTEMELRDGGRGLDESEFRKTYAAGASRKRIVQDILGTMPDVSIGALVASGLSGVTSHKIAFTGSSRRALDKLGRSWYFEWSVQDGAAQVLDRNQSSRPQVMAVVLSPTSGMIGSPTKTNVGCKVKSLLRPDILPGVILDVRSDFAKGYFKTVSVKHEGDTHGREWFSTMEAKTI